MLLFTKRIGSILGEDLKKLLGVDNVSLRRGDIYIEDNKGYNCSYDNTTSPWMLGKRVLRNLLSVSFVFLSTKYLRSFYLVV